MISLSLCRETALNMFLMSKDTRARVGKDPWDSGLEMYFSTPSRRVLITVVMPP